MASNMFAATAPEKILGAEMFGPVARASRANCVRSPNSAMKVVVKESRITASAPFFVVLVDLLPWI